MSQLYTLRRSAWCLVLNSLISIVDQVVLLLCERIQVSTLRRNHTLILTSRLDSTTFYFALFMRGTYRVAWSHSLELLLMLSDTCVCQKVIHGDFWVQMVDVRVDYPTVLSLHFSVIHSRVILSVHDLLHILVEPFLCVFVQVLAVFLKFRIV